MLQDLFHQNKIAFTDNSGFSNMSEYDYFGSSCDSGLPYTPIHTNGGHNQMDYKVQSHTNQYVTHHQYSGAHPNIFHQQPLQYQQLQQQNTHHQNAFGPMRSPSGGKPAAMMQITCLDEDDNNNDDEEDEDAEPVPSNTDVFLNKFQAQMSQMKSAMDAVQSEIFHHSGSGGKPRAAAAMVAAANNSPYAKRGPGRPRGSGVGSPQSPAVRYQSQISTINGLKLKIKKSPRQLKRKGSKTKGKRRKKKGDEDEEDDDEGSEDERDFKRSGTLQKSTKNLQTGGGGDGDVEEGLGTGETSSEPSGWGDNLPENALTKILSYAVKYEEGCIPVLVRASKVSRLWYKTVSSHPELWTTVDLSSVRVKDKFKIERNLIYFIEHRFHGANHLNLGGWSSALTNASIDVMIRYCKNLESLGLNLCQKLTAQNLKTITESCISLKKLDLSAISTTYNTKTAVSPAALGEMAETMGSRLTFLSLANNCLANCPQIVVSLSDNCPNLQALDLSNVTSPRRDTIPINIEHFQQGCQKLKILRLTNSDFALSETHLKEQASSPGFPNLEELSIAVDPKRNQGMDEGDLERILKNAHKLRLLDVRGCSRIGDSGLVRIGAWDLEHLYLSGCYATKSSNDGLELVARKWRHSFKEIDFSWTPGEETINSAMRALGEMDDDTWPPLRVLDLCGSSVSFESVKVALRTCMNLERLNLTSCRALPRGIKRNYQTIDEVMTLREQVLSGKFDYHPDD